MTESFQGFRGDCFRDASARGRCRFIRVYSIFAAFLVFAVQAQVAQAQSWPARPLRLIATNPPGGTADTLARSIGAELGALLGQPVVVENRPGANGNLGAEIVAKAPADGYTFLITPPGPLAINASLYTALPFDAQTAFAPVSMVAVAPLLLVVNPALPVTNVRELIAYAKANPGRLSAASQGNGSTGQLALELFKSMTGTDILHVPYKGSAPALTDLLAGRVQLMFDNTTTSLPHTRAGALRALAVAEPKRIRAAPDIPTVDESGLAGFEATPWFGIVARAGTPRDIVMRMSEGIAMVLRKPEVEARFAELGVELRGLSPDEFARHIRVETQKWERIVRISGARAD